MIKLSPHPYRTKFIFKNTSINIYFTAVIRTSARKPCRTERYTGGQMLICVMPDIEILPPGGHDITGCNNFGVCIKMTQQETFTVEAFVLSYFISHVTTALVGPVPEN